MFLALITCLTFHAQVANVTAGYFDDDSGPEHTRAALFSTLDGIPPGAAYVITSQFFLDTIAEGFYTLAADDFTITDAQWRIHSVNVQGAYYNGPAGVVHVADSVSLYIFAHDEETGKPANLDFSKALYAFERVPYTDRLSGDFTVTLPGDGILLERGTYWLAFHAVMEATTMGQWGWTESSLIPDTGLTRGFESVWFQENHGWVIPPDGYGLCIEEWGRRVTGCGLTHDNGTDPEKDMAFFFEGTSVALAADDQLPSFDRKGHMMAFSSDSMPKKGAPSQVFLLNRANQTVETVVASSTGAYSPSLSSNGDLIVFQSQDDLTGQNGSNNMEVFLLELGTMNVSQVSQSGPVGTQAPRITADGKWVGFLSAADLTGANPDNSMELFLYDVANQTTLQISDDAGDDPSANVSSFALNDNGNRIAYIKALGGNQLFLYIADSLQTYSIDPGDVSSVSLDGSGQVLCFSSSGNQLGTNPDGNTEIFIFEGEPGTGSYSQVTSSEIVTSQSVLLTQDSSMAYFVSDGDFSGQNGNQDMVLYRYLRSKNMFVQVPGAIQGFTGLTVNEQGTRAAFSSLKEGAQSITFYGLPQGFYDVLPTWPDTFKVLQMVPFTDY